MLSLLSRRSFSRNGCDLWLLGPGVRRACAAGLLVSYRPLAGLTSGVLRAFHGPRQASAEVSRAAAGAVATRSEERTPPTRARPFVAGADFPTVRVRVLRRRFGAAPTLQRAHTLDSTDASTFFLCIAAAARDHDDASPSGKSDDDEGSSGDGEPSSPLEPSEAFKRPRLASDARKPIQTRAREPRPLWHDHAEETDAPPIAPRRPWRQPRAASPPPEASEAPDATPSEPSEAPTPESNARTLYDTAAASPSPPPPAPTPAPAAPDPGSDANAPGDSPKATPTNAATNAVAQEKSTS